ncbi:MAG: methionyl-tRNA formyltransferase [Desulfobacterales bacterium]|nr:methionyl-tRNA formyltransferase [Desulfobacterales bacterium]
MKKRSRIIFMGTPLFAVPALTALHETGYQMMLVVTQPDRQKGRGRHVVPPPVKETALRLGCDVLQPLSVRSEEFLDRIRQLRPDMLVVVAFGRILPKALLDIPRLGAINLHASLLPKYRGPAPIQWSIINGDQETGVSTMLMDEGTDTGDILLAEKIKIALDDNSATLHERLADLGAALLIKTLEAFQAGKITPRAQDHTRATYAPLLKKTDGHIPWSRPAAMIEIFIRAMTPWPGAFTFQNGKQLKIFKSAPVSMDVAEPPGTALKWFPDELLVATGKGALNIFEVQIQGGRRLPVKEFLRGCKVPPGTRFD